MDDVNSIICRMRQLFGLLGIIEQVKNDTEIKLTDIFKKFKDEYKEDPSNEGYSFLNQHTFIAFLFIYICLPKEVFYNELPDIEVSELPESWGLKKQKNVKLKQIVRYIRNSLSHYDFEITNELLYKFNYNETKSLTLDEKNLQDFSESLTYWYLTKKIDFT